MVEGFQLAGKSSSERQDKSMIIVVYCTLCKEAAKHLQPRVLLVVRQSAVLVMVVMILTRRNSYQGA